MNRRHARVFIGPLIGGDFDHPSYFMVLSSNGNMAKMAYTGRRPGRKAREELAQGENSFKVSSMKLLNGIAEAIKDAKADATTEPQQGD